MEELEAAIAAYETKRVDFRFRGRSLNLSLSHALFSSADVDTGTRLLLRVLSRLWDEDLTAGRALPRTVLDAGSGVGVIGIAVASALLAEA
jgi:16S rRNA G1207 methylase RsmC